MVCQYIQNEILIHLVSKVLKPNSNYVPGVIHFGYARGTARGVAPRAHLAMYKVVRAIDLEFTFATDLLAGMEQAILDGVDIMSLSMGINQMSYFTDVIAIASLFAIEKGIFVVCAGSNYDSIFKTVYNGAPWITTVGAGTFDRIFQATVTFENGVSFEGTSYFPESVFITLWQRQLEQCSVQPDSIG